MSLFWGLNMLVIKNRINMMRKFRRITQCEMAKSLGITRSYLLKIENYKHPISARLMEKICEYFDLKLEDLFYLEVVEC